MSWFSFCDALIYQEKKQNVLEFLNYAPTFSHTTFGVVFLPLLML